MAKCTHPRAFVRHMGGTLYRCTSCGELRGTIDFGEMLDLIAPPHLDPEYARRVASGESWVKALGPLPKARSWK